MNEQLELLNKIVIASRQDIDKDTSVVFLTQHATNGLKVNV